MGEDKSYQIYTLSRENAADIRKTLKTKNKQVWSNGFTSLPLPNQEHSILEDPYSFPILGSWQGIIWRHSPMGSSQKIVLYFLNGGGGPVFLHFMWNFGGHWFWPWKPDFFLPKVTFLFLIVGGSTCLRNIPKKSKKELRLCLREIWRKGLDKGRPRAHHA